MSSGEKRQTEHNFRNLLKRINLQGWSAVVGITSEDYAGDIFATSMHTLILHISDGQQTPGIKSMEKAAAGLVITEWWLEANR